MPPHRRHPFHDVQSGDRSDPRRERGRRPTSEPTRETIDLMRRRLALEAQAAARGPQELFRDAVAREQEWAL